MATGENLFSHQDARNLIRYGGMRPDRDWLQFDCALSYGLCEYQRTLAMLKDIRSAQEKQFATLQANNYLLVQNTANLGAMLWLFHSQGLLPDLVGWLCVHGTTELFAILLAGAAGLHIGRSIAFPGERSVLDSAAEAGRRAATVMAGVVLMLIVAAMLEGFARQLVTDMSSRFTIGGAMLALWCAYFFAFRRNPERLQ